MRILCTHPGKAGDLLWALPSVRAIAETYGDDGKVELEIPTYLDHMTQLLVAQPYISSVRVNAEWAVRFEAPVVPWASPTEETDPRWHAVLHLGYRGWPMGRNLAESTWDLVEKELLQGETEIQGKLDLERPWIVVPKGFQEPPDIAVGISEEWIELKMGTVLALAAALEPSEVRLGVLHAPRSRHQEWAMVEQPNLVFWPCSWTWMGAAIEGSRLFLGCLSSAWVLANALGKQTVIFEPSQPRHHPVFWFEHPRNTKVDWDARAVVKAVREKLGGRG